MNHVVESALKVLLTGLLFGAGLPILFSTGVHLLSLGRPEPDADGTARTRPVPLVASVLCFAVVVAMVIVGILFLMRKSLDHYLGIQIF